MKNEKLKEQLLDAVLNQIGDDYANGDVGAVYELIKHIETSALINYLHDALHDHYIELVKPSNQL